VISDGPSHRICALRKRIENRLPRVREMTLEDPHQAGTGAGHRALAVCRDLIISLLRLAEHTSIAHALRHHARHPEDAIALVARENPTMQ
jgi:hypothetical protein